MTVTYWGIKNIEITKSIVTVIYERLIRGVVFGGTRVNIRKVNTSEWKKRYRLKRIKGSVWFYPETWTDLKYLEIHEKKTHKGFSLTKNTVCLSKFTVSLITHLLCDNYSVYYNKITVNVSYNFEIVYGLSVLIEWIGSLRGKGFVRLNPDFITTF